MFPFRRFISDVYKVALGRELITDVEKVTPEMFRCIWAEIF
jgi:hypothetical protein